MSETATSGEWKTPIPLDPAADKWADPQTGAEHPCSLLCEWCCSRRAEFHEPNHDRYLCRPCAFETAPARHTVPYRRVRHDLYNGFPDSHRGVTNRLAIHAAELLFTAQGGEMQTIYVHNCDDDSAPDLRDVQFAVMEIGYHTFREKEPYWEDLSDEASLDAHYAFYKRRAFSGECSGDPLMSALHRLCLCTEAKTDAEARWQVMNALEKAIEHLKRTDNLPTYGTGETAKGEGDVH